MSLPVQLAQAAPQTYDFESDVSGNWDMTISNNLSSGAHVVTVQDEAGNTDQAIMYVIKETQTATSTGTTGPVQNQVVLVDRITKTVPDYLHIPIGILAGLCLLLALLVLFFARRMDKNEKEQAKVNLSGQTPAQNSDAANKLHHYLIYAILVTVVTLVAVIVVGIWLNRETNFLSRFFVPASTTGFIDEINGQILDPFTRVGIVGADLVSGQTSIRTSGSGNFIFSNVNTGEGIRVTHPGLLRGLVIIPPNSPKNQRLDILFNEQMYITLVRVLDDEARGQIGDIYTKYLSPDVKNQVTEDMFIVNYTNTLTAKNLTDQQIVIKSMKIVDNYNLSKYQVSIVKAVVLTLSLNGEDVVYVLQSAGDKWYVAK